LEDGGNWALGFWASTISAVLALVLFLCATKRYRHFKPQGNPLSRFCQVLVAASRKWKAEMTPRGEDLFEFQEKDYAKNANRKILHTQGFK